MKALSIRQPWAQLIVQGIKDIENRQWSTSYRGELLIHASKAVDLDLCQQYAEYLPCGLLTGGIIGKASLVAVVSKSDSPWFQGKYGFVLKNARTMPFVPMRGFLHFFDVDDALLARAEEATHA